MQRSVTWPTGRHTARARGLRESGLLIVSPAPLASLPDVYRCGEYFRGRLLSATRLVLRRGVGEDRRVWSRLTNFCIRKIETLQGALVAANFGLDLLSTRPDVARRANLHGVFRYGIAVCLDIAVAIGLPRALLQCEQFVLELSGQGRRNDAESQQQH